MQPNHCFRLTFYQDNHAIPRCSLICSNPKERGRQKYMCSTGQPPGKACVPIELVISLF
jgi:hypothetical protein